MILGNQCTRGCGFCGVPKRRHPGSPDPDEPARVAEAALIMGLRHVVITSVNRDDLSDGGAAHFAATVLEVRRAVPTARVEVLTPDFQGRMDSVATILDAGPDVFNHNLETVPRLYRRVRPRADYQQSLAVLRFAKAHRPEALTKSGLMLGLGETRQEIEQALRDLMASGVEIVTLGQYLQPTRRSLPVGEYLRPEQFDGYRDYGRALGFRLVFSGPLVRSSYMADSIHREVAGT
jgi:lipoic acid synthetase